MSPRLKEYLRWLATSVHRVTLTRWNLRRNRHRRHRRLEIGTGQTRLHGFETLNVVYHRATDYIHDAARPLPFADSSFSIVYASHVLEHIPWYQGLAVVRDWVRVLEPGGALELWVPDALLICRTLVACEESHSSAAIKDDWWRFNARQDPALWAAGRLFSYGDGTGAARSPNWHRALYTPRFLASVMKSAGPSEIERLEPSHVRGDDHGWINLGMRGVRH